MKYDLHSHSHYSDGSLSPNELVKQALKADITHLALTDHDTVAGLSEARAAAQEYGLVLIDGVEFSCSWNHQLLHVVGLNIDPINTDLMTGIKQNRQRRLDRAEKMFEDFEQHGIFLREAVQALLHKGAVPTRPHFAQALVDRQYAKDKKQAFRRYLVRGKPGYIPMQWPSLGEVGAWIVAAGGVAVLAHPMRYKFTRTKLIKLIADMQVANIRGIEVTTAITNKQQSEMLTQLAIQHNLLASTGSDFHSDDQPWARLGCVAPLDKTLTPVWNHF